MSDDFDVDAFLSDAKPRIAEASVCVRGDLLDLHAQLEAKLRDELQADAKRNKGHRAPAVAEEIGALEAEIAEATRVFRFRSMGRHAWRELKTQHPPRPVDEKEGIDFDADTFPVAAIAASSLEPKISDHQAQRLDAELNESEFGALWAAVVNANLGVVVEGPKSVLASAVLARPNGDGSTTSSPEASPPASETDGDADQSMNTSTTPTGG